MSIYRRKLQSGKRCKTYTAEFVAGGKVFRKNGFVNRQIAEDWLNAQKVRRQRGELGLVRPVMSRQVPELISGFIEYLTSRGRADKYIEVMEKRLNRLMSECGWQVVGDVTMDSLNQWIGRRPRFQKHYLTGKTINQFLDSAKTFCKWLKKQKQVVAFNPLEDMEDVKETPNKFYRRAATMDEIQRLISHSTADRRLFYTFLVYTPLRMRAVNGLVWDDLRLDDERPSVQLHARFDKDNRGKHLPLRLDIAHALRLHKKATRPAGDDKVFPNAPTIQDLRADLKAAGIEFSDASGNRRLDLHAFRRTLIKLLKQSGVSMDVAHQALGHADRRTTEKWYDDDLVDAPLTNALEQIPAIVPLRIAGEK